MAQVTILTENKRGCGFRTPGKSGVGIYLVSDGAGEACERLPYPLDVCPCCGAGVKFSRGFTWVMPEQLLSERPFCTPNHPDFSNHRHDKCPVCDPAKFGGKTGLMWVGEKYYPTPEHFQRESDAMGVSKKVNGVPRDFVVGEHYVLLAHKKALFDIVTKEDGSREVQYQAGIFSVFRPTGVDLVIKDPNNIPELALNIQERVGDAARIVVVRRNEDVQASLL